MEKYYFIVEGREQKGPFTLEQLKTMPLTRDTKIWYQGLDDWKMISEVPELDELSYFLPPPVGNSNWMPNNESNNMDGNTLPKTWLTEGILVALFCCLPLGIAAILQASKVEAKFNSGDFEGANQASEQAKKYMQMGFWGGLIVSVLYLLIVMSSGGRNVGF